MTEEEKLEGEKKKKKKTESELKFEDTLQKTVKHYASTPKMKYRHPKTANQEIGWDGSLPLLKSFQNYKKASCNETLFAVAYFSMKGYGLYSNNNKVGMVSVPKTQRK